VNSEFPNSDRDSGPRKSAWYFLKRRSGDDGHGYAGEMAALKAAGCERIYREKASGGRWDRPELHRLLDHLRKGDVLVVWKLDRLSRSLRDVLRIMEKLGEAKAGFRSLTAG
jgi:DNA invertase Pin-like site-specific DNA recombinase